MEADEIQLTFPLDSKEALKNPDYVKNEDNMQSMSLICTDSTERQYHQILVED
jgi:hypothetical protein